MNHSIVFITGALLLLLVTCNNLRADVLRCNSFSGFYEGKVDSWFGDSFRFKTDKNRYVLASLTNCTIEVEKAL